MLVSRRAPDTGLWTVIASRLVEYPGPWDQLEMLLLNRSMLMTVEVEYSDFVRDWQVFHDAR